MSVIKSVLLAIDLATTKRDQAGRALMQVQRAYEFAQNQMMQLSSYAAETESKWAAAANAGTSPEMMRHHYQFMDRLNHAMALQQGALDGAMQKVDVAKRQVLDAEIRLGSLQLALKKKQADVAVLQARREQKQSDEFAALRSMQLSNRTLHGDPT